MGKKTDSPKKKPEKKEKKKKDPNAPKRAASGYLFYSNARRPLLKEEQPNLAVKDIMGVLGTEWKALSDAEKKPYLDMAEEDKKRYAKEKGNGFCFGFLILVKGNWPFVLFLAAYDKTQGK